MGRHKISFLDIMAPDVYDVIHGCLPDDFEIDFVNSNDPDLHFKSVRDATFILTGYAPVNSALISAAPHLKLIQKWGIGYDKIDLEAARQAGVGVSIAFGCNAGPVAELAIGLMLAVYRHIPLCDRRLREGVSLKQRMRSIAFQISGKTVGLFGFGNIARMVAHRLRGFDVDVIYYDVRGADPVTEAALNARRVSFDELLASSDILSVHAPLNAGTRNAIDATAISKMKQGAVIINTARGGVVNERDLYEALASGKLLGAGVDAFEVEPPPADHPFMALDNVVVTPHSGGGVFDNVENVARHAFRNMRLCLDNTEMPREDVIVAPGQKLERHLAGGAK